MQLNTRVLEGRWNEQDGIWRLSVCLSPLFSSIEANGCRTLEDVNTKEQRQDWAHIFVNGTGILNTWKWPEIEGLHDFSGPLMHSAKWDHTVDFDNKTVGVIGTGSSSVQIVPQLQKICKEVQVFMRSPTWISPPFGAG